MPSSAVTAAISARSISAPVASPPAWAIRLRWWPPSRVSASAPAASRSNSAPRAISLATSSGPSLTRTRTASSMHSPAPATRVSSMCCSTVSPSACTEAMPPWAQWVEPAETSSLVTTMTRPRFRHSSAAVRPGDARADRRPRRPRRPSPATRRPAAAAAGAEWAGRAAEARQRALPCVLVRAAGVQGVVPLLVNRDATSGTMVDMLPHQPLEAPNARSWFDAWLESAYGADGFWRRHWPDEHFRTAVATSPLFAEAVAEWPTGSGSTSSSMSGPAGATARPGSGRVGDRSPAGRDRPPSAAGCAAHESRLGRGSVGRAVRALDHRAGGGAAGWRRPGARCRGRVAGRPARARW